MSNSHEVTMVVVDDEWIGGLDDEAEMIRLLFPVKATATSRRNFSQICNEYNNELIK